MSTTRRRRNGRLADARRLEELKIEAARAMGLWERIQAAGWGSLSAVENGRIGGYITRELQQGRAQGPLPR